jgi:hypothetical protein
LVFRWITTSPVHPYLDGSQPGWFWPEFGHFWRPFLFILHQEEANSG